MVEESGDAEASRCSYPLSRIIPKMMRLQMLSEWIILLHISDNPSRSEGWKPVNWDTQSMRKLCQLGYSVNEETVSTAKLCQPIISDN